jgi:1-acyl-sn-glycerol-3-phosphate acyltransferase
MGYSFLLRTSIHNFTLLQMKKIGEILGGFWKIYAAILFVIFLVILYPLYALLLRKESGFKTAFKALRVHTYLILFTTGIFVKIEGRDYLKNLKACVIAPNHTSYLDILMLYIAVPNYFVFMGKHTLKTIPLFRIFFKEMNIAVNRKSIMSGKEALYRCSVELKKGNGIAMFPEGTIPDNVPNMLKFKAGAFKLAIEEQVPIVPITFLNNYKRLELGGLFSGMAGPGISRIVVHEPISTIGMTEEDLLHLQKKVFDTINNQVEKYVSR